nr:MAG TPA: hypothetical protein [Caudoviricetes sp.]
MMKRLSEFKSADEGYYLRDLQVFLEYAEAEEVVETTEEQEMRFDLIELGKMAVNYAARLERGGYGD